MKYLQRYLSLLFALVMCVGVFSVPVKATDNIDTSHIYITSNLFYDDAVDWDEQASIVTYPNNGTKEYTNKIIEWYVHSITAPAFIRREFYIRPNDNAVLFQKGRIVKLSLYNIYVSDLIVGKDIDEYSYNVDINSTGFYIYYADGTQGYVGGSVTGEGKIYNAYLEFEPTKDVLYIGFTLKNIISNTDAFKGSLGSIISVHSYLGEYDDKSLILQYGQQSEEASLIDKIKDKVGEIKDKLDDVSQAVTELPDRLWDKISNGLKGLFVPSEESMTAYKDKWDELLASRFGAVYQVVNILTDSWDGIMQADKTDTIEFPQATLNFSGTPFTFGGYDVKIVPDGFAVLVTAVKSIVAIVCTVAFVNGLRKRYDEVMGVEQ